MKFLTSSLILILLGLGHPTQAETFEDVGVDAYCKWSSRTRVALTKDDLKFSDGSSKDKNLPLRFVEQIVGPRSGKLHVVEKTGSQWASALGNPLFLPTILGPESASFFGFFKFDDSHMTLPNVSEINKALDVLSWRLKKWKLAPIKLRFSPRIPDSSFAHGFQAEDEPTRSFVEDFQLEMDSHGPQAITNLHFLAPAFIFDPVFERARMFSERLREFTFILRARTDGGEIHTLGRIAFAKRLLSVRADHVKVYGGNLTQVLRLLHEGQEDLALVELTEDLNSLLYNRRSGTLDGAVGDFIEMMVRDRLLNDPNFTQGKAAMILDAFRAFKERYPPKSHLYNLDPHLTLVAVKNRIREIKMALARP